MKQKKEHPGMECSYKSRSPHNFYEAPQGASWVWPPRGGSWLAGFPHPVASARERLPPPLAKTNRFESREEKELAHYPEAPSRWVEPTVSAIIKTNQIYRFFRLSDKNT